MSATRRPLAEAEAIAAEIIAQLKPHCIPAHCEVAGSIRRRRPTIGDIEIVCIPRPYDATPMLRSGLALALDRWEIARGNLPCRYTQRIHLSGMAVDLFMPDPRGYGLQMAIRTGSADWSHQVLAKAWNRAGYRSEGGVLRDSAGRMIATPTERDLFRLIGLPWVEPWEREVPPPADQGIGLTESTTIAHPLPGT